VLLLLGCLVIKMTRETQRTFQKKKLTQRMMQYTQWLPETAGACAVRTLKRNPFRDSVQNYHLGQYEIEAQGPAPPQFPMTELSPYPSNLPLPPRNVGSCYVLAAEQKLRHFLLALF